MPINAAALTTQADGTASRMTDLTALVETTISGPDIELNRARINWVRGRGCARPTTVGTVFAYSYGLIVAPETLDVADIDPNLAGASGFAWWAHRNHLICPNSHLRSVTSTTFENETQGMSFAIKTPSARRLSGFATSVWFVESVQLAGLTDCAWGFDFNVEVA